VTAWTLQPAKLKIMPLKFLDNNGSGTTSGAIRAIYYAVNNGARVLNNSWGGGGFSSALVDAITYSYTNRALFVAAAGNASNNNDASATYPANYAVPNVVSVAATSSMDGFASFSNYGRSTVHMGSPGVSIWSTFPNESFGSSSGTSMAAPFSSGVAAMMMREKPTMSGYEAKNILFSGSQAVASLTSRTTTGSRLNIYLSILAAKNTSVDGSQPAFSASSIRAPASAEMEAPACGLVAKKMLDSSSGGGPSGPLKNLTFFAVLLLLVSPILVSVALRERD
ncbi:MAG: S8 family serine peptidase, partial [Bdellovibrionota bacterium]